MKIQIDTNSSTINIIGSTNVIELYNLMQVISKELNVPLESWNIIPNETTNPIVPYQPDNYPMPPYYQMPVITCDTK